MRALIDGDILLYQYGSLTDDVGKPLTWNLIVNHLNAKIREIQEAVDASEYTIFITGKNNFRNEVATIRPYKGTRVSEKPHSYERVKSYLTSGKPHPFGVTDWYEADDAMSIAQYQAFSKAVGLSQAQTNDYSTDTNWDHLWSTNKATCICSTDKDLKMVPGYHYAWGVGSRQKEKPMYLVTPEEGIHWFFQQLLMGDSTDNIPGLYNYGPAKAKKRLEGITDPLSLYSAVQEEYSKRFGSYWEMFMHENATLLWMLMDEKDGRLEATKMLQDFEAKRLKKLEDDVLLEETPF